MAQAFGLIETSVIRRASKTPFKTTSILNGPFSTLVVAGLFLPGDAAEDASYCLQRISRPAFAVLPLEDGRLESAASTRSRAPRSTPLPVRMPNSSPTGPRTGSISSVISPPSEIGKVVRQNRAYPISTR